MFLRRVPGPGLRPFIASIWYYEARLPHAFERVLPSGRMQLLVNLDADSLREWRGPAFERRVETSGAAVQGPADRPTMIDTAEQRRVVGVELLPGSATPCLAASAAALRNALVPLDALWGAEGASLRTRLLEAHDPASMLATLEAILERRCRGHAPDPVTTRAAVLLDGRRRVGDVAAILGLSRRRLADRLEAGVGLGPKRYSRLRRFQGLVAAAARCPTPHWAELAAAHGYSDQSHLVHEFRSFAGMTPTSYTPRNPGEANHVVVAR